MTPSTAPGSRAGTRLPECLANHLTQCGHQEPGVSLAPAIHSSSVSVDFLLVQYWYLIRFGSGGLITPAMWPEPARTNSTGPPNSFDPTNTDFAGAMWSSRVASS